jgi:hypothetical protein
MFAVKKLHEMRRSCGKDVSRYAYTVWAPYGFGDESRKARVAVP